MTVECLVLNGAYPSLQGSGIFLEEEVQRVLRARGGRKLQGDSTLWSQQGRGNCIFCNMHKAVKVKPDKVLHRWAKMGTTFHY